MSAPAALLCLAPAGCGGPDEVAAVLPAAASAPHPASAETPEPDAAAIQEEARRAAERMRREKPEVDPYAGMTDAQREASDMAAMGSFDDRFSAWVASPEVQALDPRTLPQVGTLAQWAVGDGSLLEAVNKADVAVLGTVERTRFRGWSTLTRFRVERVAKGASPATIVVVQNGVRPGESFEVPGHRTDGAQIAADEAVPFLAPGDRAVLLLNELDARERQALAVDRAYTIRPWSGEFRVAGGRIRAVAGCDFADDVDGESAAALLDRVKRYA